MVNSKNGAVFLILFTFQESGEDFRSRVAGIAVADYSFTLDALALKPSSFWAHQRWGLSFISVS